MVSNAYQFRWWILSKTWDSTRALSSLNSIYKGGLACLPASIYMCITTPWDSSTWKPMRSPMKQSDEIEHFLQEGAFVMMISFDFPRVSSHTLLHIVAPHNKCGSRKIGNPNFTAKELEYTVLS